ncbi:hypothetical protein [Nonomuraea jabiensis]|uniref:hypothetical protein n=1 Tax=Nonomuraea jabiensis TaxID=882448 RepID=UPI00367D353A
MSKMFFNMLAAFAEVQLANGRGHPGEGHAQRDQHDDEDEHEHQRDRPDRRPGQAERRRVRQGKHGSRERRTTSATVDG